MKRNIINIICAICMICGFTACKENTSDLNLSGNCMIESITLDNYQGIIDLTTRTITVRLPEVYETTAMKVTSLSISQGAVCNIRQGQTINLDAAKMIRVQNGDVILDWTVRVLHDEARIRAFILNDIYQGSINQEARTITVYVPATVDIRNLIPTVTYSENASITPASGSAQDFTNPVSYTVKNNSAETVYTVTVIAIDKPKALFVGSAPTMNELDPEAREACLWMLGNVEGSLYTSFADLRAGTLDLTECKVIWWHWHVDGGVDGHDVFAAKATDALETKNELRAFYENGGSLFLTRYATNLPSFIGVTGDDEWTTPNNCWGQNEDGAELCNSPWSFRIYDGQNGHALWQNLIPGDNPQEVYCTDAGYHITNSTAQYHIGTDWGGYDNHNAWKERTGGEILGVGGDGAVVAWEYPAKEGKGHIICIGSGCYDWYSYTLEAGYVENFHKNISIITKNAFNCLMK